MNRYAAWIVRNRKLVVWAWVAALAVAIYAASFISADFQDDFSLPASDSQQAVEMLEKNFPGQAGDTGQLVFAAKAGVNDKHVRGTIEGALAKIEKVPGISSTTSPWSEAGQLQVSPDGQIAFATINWSEPIQTVDIEKKVDPVLEIIERANGPGLQVEGGGNPFQSAQAEENRTSEAVGVSAAMIILFIMFGSFLAMGMPILTALLAVGLTELLLEFSTHIFTTAQFATFLAAMIGLGVGIDYALFIVTRYRQALRDGQHPHAAVVIAMSTAGRAVMFAGITVMIALLGLFLVGIAFLYGPAVAASLAVLLTMIASITLLPALLAIAGTKINDPFHVTLLSAAKRNLAKFSAGQTLAGVISLPLVALQIVLWPIARVLYALVIELPKLLLGLVGVKAPQRDHSVGNGQERLEKSRWYTWSAFVQRHPWIVTAVSGGFLVILAIPAFSMHLGVADAGTQPSERTVRQAYDLLAKGFGPGFNGPLSIVISDKADEQQIETLHKQLAGDPDVVGEAVSPPVPSPNGKVSLITVYPQSSPQDEETDHLVKRIRSDYLAPLNRAGVDAHVAGSTAIMGDFTELIGKRLPYFIGAVVLLSALLLAAVFRSVLVPVKAVVMNLIGILSAFGVIVAIFQWGWGASLIGVDQTAPIMSFLPVMLFAIVFGLSMDYEVFLMSRVHEEWIKTGRADEAVLKGLAATAGVITAAAIIMVVLFSSFAVLTDDMTIKLFGVSLAVTIFLDAFIVRTALVPAVMAIMGKAAWWMPKWLDRILPTVNVEGAEDEVVPAVVESTDNDQQS